MASSGRASSSVTPQTSVPVILNTISDPSRFLIHRDVSGLLQPPDLLGSGTERSALVNFDDVSSLRKTVLDRLDRAADVLDITSGVRRPERAGAGSACFLISNTSLSSS
jgi:hypothetical protein